jgi:NB-ARC domain
VYVNARAQVQWPLRLGVVPPRADKRRGRPVDQELAAVQRSAVVTGLGGVGKTQLAIELAERAWRQCEIDMLLWVAATSRADIVASYAQAAVEIIGVDETSPEKAAERFLAWLAGTTRRWLVVLDDLADPDDLQRLWPPGHPSSGRTIVTTRRRDAALLGGRDLIEVGVFTPEESVRYLQDKLRPGQVAGAPDLAEDLGHLPLALAHAAAFIADHDGQTCAGYRSRLADHRRRLPDLAPHALPDDYPATVAITWQISVDRADSQVPAHLARPVLELAALHDLNAIPISLMTADPILACLAHRHGADDIRDALHNLRRLSLISIDRDTDTAGIHTLVQRAVREAIPAERARSLGTAAAEALLPALPGAAASQGDVARWLALRPHATTLACHLPAHSQQSLRLRRALASWTGYLDGDRPARDLLTALADEYQLVLGSDHRETLEVRAAATWWTGACGDRAAARQLLRPLIADAARVLGPADPCTLTMRDSEAHWAGEAGDYGSARDSYALVVSDARAALGRDDPVTLRAEDGLARWTGEAGEPDAARDAYARLVPRTAVVLGPADQLSLRARACLAWWTGMAGDPADARAQYAELLADSIEQLGPDHRNVWGTREGMARWVGESGDPAAAAALFAEIADRVGLDYWIWPGQASRLGSSLSDHFRPLSACTLPDGAGTAPDVQGRRTAGAPSRERCLAPPGWPGPLRAGRPAVASGTVAIGSQAPVG